MRRSTALIAAAAALLVAIGVTAGSFFGSGYRVTVRFQNAGQLIVGGPVQTGGQSIGKVTDIELTDDGRADVTFEMDELHAPLPQGTRAAVKQLSLSGLANRVVDLDIPPDSGQGRIPDGGRVTADEARTQVDFDQVLAMLDPRTRRALQDFLQGQAATLRGRGRELRRGFSYLNPSLAITSRLFGELTRDVPLLERTLSDSARMVTAVGERRDELASLVGHARDAMRALGDQKLALADSIGRFPGFMRRANTTFVNLRGTLDDVDELVEAATPVARRLRPVLAEARPFASAAIPALRDLRLAIRRPGGANDLVELMRALPPLADIATVARRRSLAPGGHEVDVGDVPAAVPQIAHALWAATPVVREMRPYTSDVLAFMDDYVATPKAYDALGKIDRAFASFAEGIYGGPPFPFQFHRCPGGAEERAPDGSNVFSSSEQEQLDCREEDRAVPR